MILSGKMEDNMMTKRLTEIAKKIYFSGSGHIDWSEVETEYKLSKSELNYVTSIIRNWNRR